MHMYIHDCLLLTMHVWLQYRQVLHNTMTKLFADLEVKKKKLEEREQSERSGAVCATLRKVYSGTPPNRHP